jgi:hypothetical protein
VQEEDENSLYGDEPVEFQGEPTFKYTKFR